jgi:hypothetical protein
MKTVRTILIVGSGRLAMHLNHWASIQQNSENKNTCKILNWDRSQDPHLIKTYIAQADDVWLAISDSAIISFYEKYLLGFDLTVVHFSGAVHDSRILSAHPLMTFSEHIYADEIYLNTHFAITGCEKLSDALHGFTNSFFILSAEQKPLYHALCVVAGNFPQMLWSEVAKICSDKQIPLRAFDSYLRQTLENFISLGEGSATGPFARHDLNTIELNQSALPVPLKNIYRAFQLELLK